MDTHLEGILASAHSVVAIGKGYQDLAILAGVILCKVLLR